MFRRVRLTCAAVVVLLATATIASAQQPDSTTANKGGSKPGRGSIGGQMGSSWILAGGDYAEGAQPRLTFEGAFRYIISPTLRWQVSPYFTWNAYKTGTALNQLDLNFPDDTNKDFFLTQIVGANAQLQLTKVRGTTIWHAGGGPSLYRVVVQNHRKVLKDAVTDRLHQGQYLGLTAEVGVEHFLHSITTTSLEWTAAYHLAYARRNDQFPSGFNANPGAIEVRFGGNYYFDFKAPKPKPGLPNRKR